MTLACEQQTFLLAHHRWWTFLLAKRPSAAISEEKSLPFAGLSEALHVTPSYTLRHTWKGSRCFPSLNECNPFQSLAALPIRAPFWLFCIFLVFFYSFKQLFCYLNQFCDRLWTYRYLLFYQLRHTRYDILKRQARQWTMFVMSHFLYKARQFQTSSTQTENKKNANELRKDKKKKKLDKGDTSG